MTAAERVPGWARAGLAGLGALLAPGPAAGLALWCDGRLRGPAFVDSWLHPPNAALLGVALYFVAVAAQHFALRRLARGRAEAALLAGVGWAALLGLVLGVAL